MARTMSGWLECTLALGVRGGLKVCGVTVAAVTTGGLEQGLMLTLMLALTLTLVLRVGRRNAGLATRRGVVTAVMGRWLKHAFLLEGQRHPVADTERSRLESALMLGVSCFMLSCTMSVAAIRAFLDNMLRILHGGSRTIIIFGLIALLRS
jgi:hypothetical protein